jgi:hypothetical protein
VPEASTVARMLREDPFTQQEDINSSGRGVWLALLNEALKTYNDYLCHMHITALGIS